MQIRRELRRLTFSESGERMQLGDLDLDQTGAHQRKRGNRLLNRRAFSLKYQYGAWTAGRTRLA